MHRKFLPFALAALVGALIVGGALAGTRATGHQAAKADDRTITVLDVTVSSTNVDVDNSNSFTVGDEFIFNDVLKTPDGSQTLGSAQGVCTLTQVSESGGSAHCATMAKLAGGNLEADGVTDPSQHEFVLALTGGTGAYDQARGELHGKQLSETQTLITIDLD